MSLGNYDGWKLRTPEDELPPDPRDDTTCPHGEDRPDDCEACNEPECEFCDFGCCACSPLVECPDDGACPHGGAM